MSFAPYHKRLPGERCGAALPEGFVVRVACTGDVEGLARLAQGRHGGEIDRHRDRFITEFEESERSPHESNILVVAEAGESILAFGRARHFMHEETHPENVAPEGWYLLGVIVDIEWRRRGIGAAVTEHRLRWIAERASHAYYFANVRNRASIDLHERFGFVEQTRDFWFPGVEFDGGVGVLYRLDMAT